MKIYIIRDELDKVIEVYNSKELVLKLIPHIESKLLVNINTIEEKQLNPTLDIVGNSNFSKKYTIKEFMDTI